MKKFLLFLGFFLLPIHSLFASDAETEKLQWHLNRVEGILRKVDTSSLTEAQKSNRIKMLDRLHSYTEAGNFPNNDKFPGESVPFFRGSNGNLCAVGYLMDADPEYKGFIEKVVNTNNNIQLMDVQTDPTVNTWAKKYGFSILELAMIQPSYSCEMLGKKIYKGACVTENQIKYDQIRSWGPMFIYGTIILLLGAGIGLVLFLKKHNFGHLGNVTGLFGLAFILLLIIGLFLLKVKIIELWIDII